MCSLVHQIIFLLSVVVCGGTIVNFKYDDIVTKTKVELKPVLITCSLNDILVLVTPVVNCHGAKYHLRKPNGDILRTEVSTPKNKFRFLNTRPYYDELSPGRVIVKYITKGVKAVYPKHMYKIINLSNDDDYEFPDALFLEESKMNKNDFMVGPLLEEDHGNWALSIYCKDIDGEWVEMFQVITVEIITSVTMNQDRVTLPEGSTFNLSFMYPIKHLETCELNAPASVTDRIFDRNQIELDKCGYVISNITSRDQGTWKVIGVGRIVYEGSVTLNVEDKKVKRNRNNDARNRHKVRELQDTNKYY